MDAEVVAAVATAVLEEGEAPSPVRGDGSAASLDVQDGGGSSSGGGSGGRTDDAPTSASEQASSAVSGHAAEWNLGRTLALSEMCAKANGSAWLHQQAEGTYRSLFYLLKMPAILLCFVTGTMGALSQVTSGSACDLRLAMVLGILTLIGATMQGAAALIGVTERMEAHRKAARGWWDLYNRLYLQLGLEPQDRTSCITITRVAMDDAKRLRSSAPSIHWTIVWQFRRQFGASLGAVMPVECAPVGPVRPNGWIEQSLIVGTRVATSAPAVAAAPLHARARQRYHHSALDRDHLRLDRADGLGRLRAVGHATVQHRLHRAHTGGLQHADFKFH